MLTKTKKFATISKAIKQLSYLHSSGLETTTNYELVNEILDKIDVEWSDPSLKFLDPFCGRGTFLLGIANRLNQSGHSFKHIVSNMLYGIDIDPVQTMIAIKALHSVSGVAPNIICSDSLTYEWNMKVDVVIGNPPFKKLAENGRATNGSLWKLFLLKSDEYVKDGGTIAMVHPTGWCYPADSMKLVPKFFAHNNLVHANISTNLQKTYFPTVGSTISYTITRKEPYTGSTEFVNDEGTSVVDLTKTRLLINNGMSIIKKITESKHERCKFVLANKSMYFEGPAYVASANPPASAIYKNVNFNSAQKHFDAGTDISVIYSVNPSPVITRKKVVLSYSGAPHVLVDDGKYGVGSCIVLLLPDDANLTAVTSIFKSKLFRYYSLQKYNQYNEATNLNQFPQLDMSKVWTDTEIYAEFNLTAAEIEHIDSIVS